MPKLVFVLILGAACACAQTVGGSVFDASTGAGVGGVKVELLKGGTAFYEAATDGGGRFRFDDVKEDDYAVRYRSPDYWLTAGSSDYRLFRVAADSPVKLEARLMPWSRISGRVVDRRGNAVANAELELTGFGMVVNGRTYLRTSWGGGGGAQLSDSPFAMNFRGKTDAQGKFEVQLMPGSYGLSVIPPPDLKPPDSDKDGPVLAWKRTYYPNVALVLPGGNVSDVELKLLTVPARAVRGVVLNPDSTPAPKVAVALGADFRSATVESKADGTFEFPAVAEGEWRLSAEAPRGSLKLRAVQWIEVARHDLDNVQLRLAAPVALRGKIVLEVPKDTAAPKPSTGPLLLSLAGGHTRDDVDLFPGIGVIAEPGANGDLMIEDVYPGVYRLARSLQGPAPPYYLDSVRVGGADLAAQEVEIASDAAIAAVYKADGGSVRGEAKNCASGGVLLVPRDPSLRGRGFSRSAPCDSSDRYEVQAVRPGDYYALAFAGNGPVLAVDDVLLNEAAKVTVRTGESSSADLTAVTKPVF